VGPRRRARQDEEGFILLESMIAISLITVILAALGTFTLNSIALTNQLRSRQAAAQIATSSMASLGAVPTSDLVTGRDPSSVSVQFTAAPASVGPSLAEMSQVSDSTASAGAGATATISTSPVAQILNNVTFSVNTYLGRCFTQATSTDCLATGAGVEQLRAVVAVTWKGQGCGSSSCVYVSSTLVNQDDDPVFYLNTANPPVLPAVEGPGNQTSTLGKAVSLQLAAKVNTGVPPLTWQVTSGTLPSGLILAASGLVTGIPTTLVASTPITVTVTDAFGRTGTASFTWTVVGPPTVTTPATQTSTLGWPVSLAVVSTCPNAPCVFTLTGAPPGLTVNAATGLVSGTPTTLGSYATVTLTSTDAAGAAASSAPFSWTVVAAPTVTTPTTQTSTVNRADTLTVVSTCPNTPCAFTLANPPPGLTINATTGLISGTPTTLGTYATVTVTRTDAAGAAASSAAFTWKVVSGPSVTTPATETSTVNRPDSLTVVSTCPNTPCAFTLANPPPGLTINATTGVISGTPTTLGSYVTVTVTSTDAGGAAASSAAFTWKVVSGPTVTTPVTQTSVVGRTASLAVASTCPNTPCAFTLANPPPGLTINTTTGLISGTPTTVGTYATVTVTSTDAAGAAASSAAFTWKVLPAPAIGALGSLSATVTAAESVAIAYTCPTATCTVTLAGTMPGLGLSATTPNLTNNTTTGLTVASGTGTVYVAGILQTTAVTSGTSTGYAPTVTITDLNLTSTTSGAGAWRAFAKPTVVGLTTRSTSVGSTPNQAVTYTCPNVPCTVVLTNTVPGLGLSATTGVTTTNATTSLVLFAATGTFYVNGLVGASAVPSGTSKVYSPTVTLTDADAISAVGTGTWTVFKAPAITDPGSQAIEPNQNLSLQMAAACPNGGCAWQAASQTGGGPTWNPLTISSTGLITFTAMPAASYTLRVIVTDGAGVTDTVFVPLTVATFNLFIATQSSTHPASGTKVVTLDASSLVTPAVAGYGYALTGQPSWLAIDPTTGVLTATLTPFSTTDPAITVTVTSLASATSTVSYTFRWSIS